MKSDRSASVLAVLGAAHAVSDGSAGWLIANCASRLSIAEVGTLTIIYNALAFAMQPAVGLLLDRIRQPRRAMFVCLGLMGLAVLLADQPLVAVTLAGLASAVFHVSAGTLAISLSHDRAAGLGVFAAPGVIGLAIGAALAATGSGALVLVLLLIAIAASAGWLTRSITLGRSEPKVTVGVDRDSIVIVVLIAIAVRSAVWSAFDWVLAGNTSMLLAAALAAGIGKIVGGILADRLGWRPWTIGSAAMAAVLLAIGPSSGGLFLIGLALLQSITPVALAATVQLLPDRSGLAAGLSLGLAIAVGGLLVFAGLGAYLASPLISLILVAGSGVTLMWALNRNPVVGESV